MDILIVRPGVKRGATPPQLPSNVNTGGERWSCAEASPWVYIGRYMAGYTPPGMPPTYPPWVYHHPTTLPCRLPVLRVLRGVQWGGSLGSKRENVMGGDLSEPLRTLRV